MPKTTISQSETIDICRYFSYLRNLYKISSDQLYNACLPELTQKTIERYTSKSAHPTHALSSTSLNSLIYGFTSILESRNIPCPPELSRNFLQSTQLSAFLDALDTDSSTLDPSLDTDKSSKIFINFDPAKNPKFIIFLFGLGASIILSLFIIKLLMPEFYFFKQLFAGLFFLTASITLALSELKQKQPLEAHPEFRSHPKLLLLLSLVMQANFFILSFSKVLMYIFFLAFVASLAF